MRSKFIDPERGVDRGLLELNRRYGSGDHGTYELFYSQGATFWQLVDAAVVTATNGQRSLDDFIDELLQSPLPTDGSLPESFIGQLRQVAGPAINQVLAKYVGK